MKFANQVICKHTITKLLFLLAAYFPAIAQAGLWSQIKSFHPDKLKVDTLKITLPDSLLSQVENTQIVIQDEREWCPEIIDIHQTTKYKYIPVDQLVISQPRLDSLLSRSFADSLPYPAGKLRIVELKLWYDSKPWFQKGTKLNAYTVFHGDDGRTADWLWEITLKRKKKEPQADYFGRMLLDFSQKQSQSLQSPSYAPLMPFLYRRQIQSWTDAILFPDAWGLNVHFTLDYPTGRRSDWVRGSPGIFFRKSHDAESISMGGRHQSWNWRVKEDFVLSSEPAFRFGFNNFDRKAHPHLDWWNIFSAQLTWENSLTWRPAFHKGLYGGIGVVQIFRALPTVLPIWEPGLMLTLGVVLP